MKETIRYGFILMFICVIAAGLLSTVNFLTQPRIIAMAQAEEEASLKEVMSQAADFKPVKSADKTLYYQAQDKNGKIIGVVFKAEGKGYSSTIETVAGMLNDGTITAVKILSQGETPGLGSRITKPDFLAQFKDKKDLSAVQAITGATISSSAVINSVREKAQEIKKLMKHG